MLSVSVRTVRLLLLFALTLPLLVVPWAVQHAAAETNTTATTTATSTSGLILAQAETGLRGRLQADGNPIVGVTLTITDAGGAVVGTVVTDDTGNWAQPVDGNGDYTVEVDVTTLPAGITLRDIDEPAKTVTVEDGTRGLLFPLVSGDAQAGRTFFERFVSLLVQGIKLGSIIALTSVGLSLIFGVTGLVNFAHGELVTFGAIVAYVVNGNLGLPLILGAVVATAMGGVFGGALELAAFRPLRRRRTGLVSMLVITIGLSFFIRHVFLLSGVFGPAPKKYLDYAVQTTPLTFGPISLAPRDLSIMIVALVVLAAVGLFLQRTTLGKAMRAVADNKDLAESSGIDVERVILTVWVMGGALAGLGGVLQGLSQAAVEYDMGFALLLLMFAGIIVGGLGTAYGAMVGGLVVGVASEVSTLFFSVEFKLVFAFMLLIGVLMIRPQGILGSAERFG